MTFRQVFNEVGLLAIFTRVREYVAEVSRLRDLLDSVQRELAAKRRENDTLNGRLVAALTEIEQLEERLQKKPKDEPNPKGTRTLPARLSIADVIQRGREVYEKNEVRQ